MGQMQDILRTYYIDDEDRLMKLRKAQAGLTETYMYVYMYTQMGYNIYIYYNIYTIYIYMHAYIASVY